MEQPRIGSWELGPPAGPRQVLDSAGALNIRGTPLLNGKSPSCHSKPYSSDHTL